MATAYTHYGKSELEKQFIVVNWDQRGSGKSYSHKMDPDTMTIQQLANDGLAVTRFLLKEFGKRKLYLVGHSWGSILGIHMIRSKPEMFHAFLSISQLVNLKASEERSLNIALDLARKANNKLAIKELEQLTRFDPEKENYLSYMAIHRSWLAKLGGLYYSGKKINPNMLFVGALLSPKYTLIDVIRLKKGLTFSVEHMWAEIMTLDLLTDKLAFEIPIYFIYGKEDTISDPELIREYFAKLQSPKKEIIELEHSGHSPQLDQFERYENEVIRLFS